MTLSINTSAINPTTPGATYTVPVLYDPTQAGDKPGGPGLDSANAAILFDPNFIDPTSIVISAGSLVPTSGWTVGSTPVFTGNNGIDASKDSIGLNLGDSTGTAPIATNSTGSLWLFQFKLMPSASGTTALNLVASARTSNALTTTTNVSDLVSAYTLNPTPTAGSTDSVDGSISVAPTPDLTLTKTHTGSFRQGDSADTYTITVSNSGTAPTTGTVTVTDTLPAGLAPTAADSGTVNGWGVSFSGQTVTATRSDALASAANYPALIVTVAVASDAPASVTNSAAVAGGGELNTANDSASDPTTVIPAADLTLTKAHAGTFRQGDAADAYTLTISNSGPGPTTSAVTVTDTLPAGLTPRPPTAARSMAGPSPSAARRSRPRAATPWPAARATRH